MSYCRFIEGDVYAYETDGGVQFWVSSDNKALDCLCDTFDEAYQYAKELRDVHGLDVPSYAIEALKEDALEEAKRISGASGVIGELQAENAKLRHMVRVYRACHDHIDACRGCYELPECDALRRLRELGREVGIEVEHA